VPSESTAELGAGANWIMLLLIFCTGWLASVFVRPAMVLRVDVIDALAGMLILLVTLSSLVMAGQGCTRATINTAWQWVGFVIFFLWCRQLLRRPAAIRAASAVMLALGVGLTALAYYQYFYSLPQMRAEFSRDPDAMLRAAGIDPAIGSPERKLFEDRLHSTEPLATFALANSLAGFLAPWLVVALGIAASARGSREEIHASNAASTPRPREAERLATSKAPVRLPKPVRLDSSWRVVLLAGLVAVLFGFALLLTKSRTALLAVGLGLSLLGLSRWPTRWPIRFRWQLVLAATLIAGVLAAATAAGVWDRQVLTETPKSLLYRFEYWKGTAAMIGDHPWFGCGPGNFQHFYATYKLPEASESIADPHNLFFEVAATFGVPALLVFSVLLGCVLWRWLPRYGFFSRTEAAGADVASVPKSSPEAGRQAAALTAEWTTTPAMSQTMYLGALAGVALGWWTGFVIGMTPDPFLLLCVPLAAAFLAGLHPWTERGRLPLTVFAVALLVLTVNLLAAGGIGFAGIAPTWWLLLAIVSNARALPSRERDLPRVAVGLLTAAAMLLVIGCFATLYSPTLRCRAKLDEGEERIQARRLGAAEAAFLAAAAADPYTAEPWNNLAALYHHEALERANEDSLSRFQSAVEQVLRRNPRAPTLRKQIGDWRLSLFARWGDDHQLQQAIVAYTEWVRLYPNHALGHAQLSLSHHLAGNDDLSQRAASEALRLDALNPHHEKKLSQQRLFNPVANSEGQRENAEQIVRRLRKTSLSK